MLTLYVYITGRFVSHLSCSTLSVAIMLWRVDSVWPWATLCWDTHVRLVSLLLYSILNMAILLWRADDPDPELCYAWILCYISSGILVVPRIIFNTYCQICAHRIQMTMLYLLWHTCGTLNRLHVVRFCPSQSIYDVSLILYPSLSISIVQWRADGIWP